MRMRLSPLLAFVACACLADPGRAGEEPLKTSDVLRELVHPLEDMSGYQLSIDEDSLAIRGISADPGAYLRAVSDSPVFRNPQWTGPAPQQGQVGEPQSFGITAEIARRPGGELDTRSGDANAAAVLAAAKRIFGEGKCALVSELETPEGAAMFRWRCPTDLQGVSDLVSGLEAERIHVEEFAVFQNTILADQPSMDMRFTAFAIPRS